MNCSLQIVFSMYFDAVIGILCVVRIFLANYVNILDAHFLAPGVAKPPGTFMLAVWNANVDESHWQCQ